MRTFWLFCTVIDNFGDIGVSWRLARELGRRLNAQVWLWLDDENALRALCPDLPPLPCRHQGIELRRWQPGSCAENWENAPAADCVIETFACTLPPQVITRLRQDHALWLNWEYLSAEDWAVRSHAMPSLQADGGSKFFWQMGFIPASGGLLREADYLEQRRRFDSQAARALRTQLKLPEKRSRSEQEALWFGYRSKIWAQWLHTLAQLNRPLTLWLAGSQIIESLRESGSIGADDLRRDGDCCCIGSVRLVKTAFVAQQDFDQLLWLADWLLIRGEDSFVRAQFATKPFFWHIYPQQQMAHLDKLDAFWQLLRPELSEPFAAAHQALSDELNGAAKLPENERLRHWQTLLEQFGSWQLETCRWQQYLFGQSDAVSRLMLFAAHCRNRSTS